MSATRWRVAALMAYRMVVALLFAAHGAASLFGVFGGARGTGEALPFAAWPGWWAALIQLVGGLLVLGGLFTRVAALICSGSMAYAYFSVHQPEALMPLNNGGELAAMFCWSFFLIAVLGADRWSLDAVMAGRTHHRRPRPTAAPDAHATPGR
ncbi:DoxX family protein [Micromonospora sp. C28SCA-DRY-2]|uniref:DoxX family protein n=1 Tax=Micromonospora sp. C28SCA-DRY-2 TaxID=3059522 RepID=UPI0026766508|nr:DoxX family protein [Micromonospora sp. C28SCA-DRY-2]MDO3703247.1 DoxX family protein [Micromonospora sp. C28SCA-DRY-2]